MRIALVSLHTSPLAQPGQGDAGGMNVYVRALAEHLAKEGHLVDVFTRDDGNRPLGWDRELSPKLHYLPVGPPHPISKDDVAELISEFGAALAPFLASQSYDAVHSHYWISGAAVLAARDQQTSEPASQPRLVHTMHTIAAVKNDSFAENTEHSQRQAAEIDICSKMDALIVNTAAEASELMQHYGACPSMLEVIAPGVNLNLFTPVGQAFRWGAERDLKVLFAGRIQPLKGPQILIDALAHWKQADNFPMHVHLLISGAQSGSHNLDLPQRVKKAGLTGQVTFAGPQPPKQLAAMFRGADVVAMPSYSESFGLVALEAQACGTPVLAHRVGGLTTAVADSVSGELLPNLEPATWASALQRWQQHPSSVARYASAARAHAESFSWSRTAEESARVYRA